MSKKTKIISALLALITVFGAFTAFSGLSVFAADEGGEEVKTIDYITQVYETKEDKLATMKLVLSKYGYELYYESYTGEVAVKNVTTGDILFTNPYDIGGAQASENIKNQFLSQIVLKYSNHEGNEISMYSYVEAAKRGQVKLKNIKNGIRVEYIMGKQESRLLLPMMIEKTRFNTVFREKILGILTAAGLEEKTLDMKSTDFNAMLKEKGLDDETVKSLKSVKSQWDYFAVFYVLKDPDDPNNTTRIKTEMQLQYPITKKMAVYVYDSEATEREHVKCEAFIKLYCPEYTYEELEFDHDLVEYENEDKNPVQFRMALEYTLDEQGVSVRLPANGIRFDQDLYQLEYIRVLPFMGTGSSEFTGYTVIPDGSGALMRFEDVVATGQSRILSAALYGADFAYHTIKGANQQIMRLPIFGLVEDTVYTVKEETPDEPAESDETTETAPAESEEPAESEPAESETAETEPVETEPAETEETDPDEEEEPKEEEPEEPEEPEIETYTRKRGFLAIIEEGDSLASITSDHGAGQQHKYASVYTEFNPRPKDSYNLASSISVAGDNTWTVVSERKYTGSFTIRYIMLTDLAYNQANGIDSDGLCDASYMGMAQAYRNRLIKEGALTQKVAEKEQIPLYVETLGVMDVVEKVLSIPVNKKKALTTFDDIETICNELAEQGISNVVLKLTGYMNGGLVNTLPRSIDLEKVVGNEKGFADLMEYVNSKDIDLYLDVDFSYSKDDELFDGFRKKRDAIKTIDDRYTQKRTYSATLQYFTPTGMVAISPSVFKDIFEDLTEDLEDLKLKSIALGTIGSDLNSDFDEDDPYNREDSKENVIKTLKAANEAGYKVMIDGGNSYANAYASHVLNAPLDSSNYTYASESVPLFGLIYHGYLNFAGSATNMAGDVRHEMLKIIENGADPYFILVYRNAEKLKESEKLSKYYSISYTNWKEDLVDTYNRLNTVLSKVMTSPIADHRFVIGERVASEEELEEDRIAEEKAAKEAADSEAAESAEEERAENLKKHLDEKKKAKAAETAETSETDVPAETDETKEGEETSAEGEETSSEPEESTEPEESEEPEEPEEPEEETGYKYTKYTSDSGMIVKVTYENGYAVILNYNVFDVTVTELGEEIIPALGYVMLDKNGTVILNSGKEA